MGAWRVLAVGACAALAACASHAPPPAPAARPIPDERPADFVFAATVFSPAELRGAELPRSLRPARYVIEADGVLRAAVGTEVGRAAGAATFPPQTRRLSPGEFDSLWRLVRESGLLDPASPMRVEDPETLVRVPDRTMALVYVSYGRERRTLRVLLDRASEGAVEAERVMERLAEWAWVK